MLPSNWGTENDCFINTQINPIHLFTYEQQFKQHIILSIYVFGFKHNLFRVNSIFKKLIQNLKMQKFQDLLTEAAQLKQQQLKNERKNFQALPEYLKSGLNYAKKYVQLRKQNYLVQKYVSQKVKTLGNDHYLLQNYGEALSKYQQALSVFRYIHATKYENLKDEDILYENYMADKQNHQQHNTHLVALYLNICSALTKMNKKDQAIHASEQAFKLNQTNPKIYYKRAQAYLQYINKDSSDVKLGFYYLNKAYEISKDNSILVQMHKIKKQIDQERQKQKSWFKFMFDKNKQTQDTTQNASQIKQTQKLISEQNPQSKSTKDQTKNTKDQSKSTKDQSKIQKLANEQKKSKQSKQTKSKVQQKPKQTKAKVEQKSRFNSEIKQLIEQAKKMPQSHLTKSQQLSQKQSRHKRYQQKLQRFKEQNQVQKPSLSKEQQQKHEKTKQNLKKYLIIPRDDRWLIKYQQDFIHKNGSKIYNILQLCNYKDFLLQFKSILAKCLDLKQATITVNKDQNQILKQKIQNYGRFIQWLKTHPIEKYLKYIQRYDLQVRWISQNRGKPLDQIYFKKDEPQIKQDKTHKLTQRLIGSKKQSQVKSTQKQQTKQPIPVTKKQTQPTAQKVQPSPPSQAQQSFARKRKQQRSSHSQQTFGFKQQWQYQEDQVRKKINSQAKKQQAKNSFGQDQVSEGLKGFLENYEELPNYESKGKSNKSEQIRRKHQQQLNDALGIEKENPFTFIRTLIIVVCITIIIKVVF